MKTAKVTLGGKEYDISALPIRASAEWRQKLVGPLDEITALLDGVGELAGAARAPGTNEEKGRLFLQSLSSLSLTRVINTVRSTVLEAPNLIIDLLFDYSPALQADRERIEAEAYDEEVAAAFLEVLKLAYPFGGLMNLLSSRATSKIRSAASTSSPAPNGASGPTS